MTDKRPDPKPHKHPLLWQSYLVWNERMQMAKSHAQRLSSIEKGKSNLDGEYERQMLEWAQEVTKYAQKEMCAYGESVGPIWNWLISIKGIAEHTAAKLLALFDDVGWFATVSKFWRFSGWAVIDGEIDRCRKGEKSPYNRRLKSECYLVAEQFVRQQTPLYVDIYYAEKERLRELHPNVICTQCGAEFSPDIKKCPDCGQTNKKFGLKYCAGHIDAMAKRKTIKIFLQHMWVCWRESEDLSVSKPWVIEHGGHCDYIEPPNWPLEE